MAIERHMRANRYSVFEVFTPTTPARRNFVPRPMLNDQLVDALLTPGKQVILYGETGSGKSTLLVNKLEQLYTSHVTSRCSNSTSFGQLLLDAFDQLDPYYIGTHSATKERRISPRLTAEFIRVRASIDATLGLSRTQNEERALPPQLTAQRLGQFLQEQGMCWVIEDFHKVGVADKQSLAQCLKIFSDLAEGQLGVKIIAVGATDAARDVVDYEPEMTHRVAELFVPLMDDAEIETIVSHGQTLLNLDFGRLIHPIVRYSVGVPSVCHQLCLNICLTNNITASHPKMVTFDAPDLNRAIEGYISESSDTLKARFGLALRRHHLARHDSHRLVLAAIASGPLEGLRTPEVLALVRQEHPDYPARNLARTVRELLSDDRGATISWTPEHRLRFIDPLHHTFAQIHLAGSVSGPPVVTEDQILSHTSIALKRSLETRRISEVLDGLIDEGSTIPPRPRGQIGNESLQVVFARSYRVGEHHIAAEIAYAAAVLTDGVDRIRWKELALRELGSLDTTRLENVTSHFMDIAGVSIPDLLHEGVIEKRLREK